MKNPENKIIEDFDKKVESSSQEGGEEKLEKEGGGSVTKSVDNESNKDIEYEPEWSDKGSKKAEDGKENHPKIKYEVSSTEERADNWSVNNEKNKEPREMEEPGKPEEKSDEEEKKEKNEREKIPDSLYNEVKSGLKEDITNLEKELGLTLPEEQKKEIGKHLGEMGKGYLKEVAHKWCETHQDELKEKGINIKNGDIDGETRVFLNQMGEDWAISKSFLEKSINEKNDYGQMVKEYLALQMVKNKFESGEPIGADTKLGTLYFIQKEVSRLEKEKKGNKGKKKYEMALKLKELHKDENDLLRSLTGEDIMKRTNKDVEEGRINFKFSKKNSEKKAEVDYEYNKFLKEHKGENLYDFIEHLVKERGYEVRWKGKSWRGDEISIIERREDETEKTIKVKGKEVVYVTPFLKRYLLQRYREKLIRDKRTEIMSANNIERKVEEMIKNPKEKVEKLYNEMKTNITTKGILEMEAKKAGISEEKIEQVWKEKGGPAVKELLENPSKRKELIESLSKNPEKIEENVSRFAGEMGIDIDFDSLTSGEKEKVKKLYKKVTKDKITPLKLFSFIAELIVLGEK